MGMLSNDAVKESLSGSVTSYCVALPLCELQQGMVNHLQRSPGTAHNGVINNQK